MNMVEDFTNIMVGLYIMEHNYKEDIGIFDKAS